MKKRYSFILLILLLFPGCGDSQPAAQPAVTAAASYPVYESIDTLAESAADIIMGRVTGSRVEELDIRIKVKEEDKDNELLNPGGEEKPSWHVYTIFTVEISGVYKGDYKTGDQMEIKRLGGDPEEYIYADGPPLELDQLQDYVFFLGPRGGTPQSLVNPFQGAYIFDTETKNTADALVNTSDTNQLTLTYNDLELIAQENNQGK